MLIQRWDSSVDGYLFLDWLSFDNFNEAKKLEESIKKYEERFEKKPQKIIADGIYGNRDNRNYLKGEQIRAALKPLGRKSKTEEYQKEKRWIKKQQRIKESHRRFYRARKGAFWVE